MKRFLAIVAICVLGSLTSPTLADDKAEYKNCSLTPASAIGSMFDTKTPADCEAACKDKAGEGCTAWSYMSPSKMFPDKPGKCRMIKTIFKEDESTRNFCGKI